MWMASAAKCLLSVHIHPNAKQNQMLGMQDGVLKLKIKAPAVEGKANQELCRYLAEYLHIPKSAITVLRGATSPHKVLEIKGLDTLPDFT
jgi:uncharacterized protein (TIGR00251 family)